MQKSPFKLADPALVTLPENLNVCCRFCGSQLRYSFVDLGTSPLCQDHVTPEKANQMEPFYPLHAFVCHECFLVQLDEYVSPSEIFDDYAYFSSYSSSWLEHVQRYAEKMTRELNLDEKSLVVELASNDGYLLQYFANQDIPVLGIEPAANVAEAAREKGIQTEVRFFGEKAALELLIQYGPADLMVGNNVLAHVPDINDFIKGIKIMLDEQGTLTMEFPHLLRLMEENQFDTIYHEHFSYLSFHTVRRMFNHHGLQVYDVEELPTHGGSLRIYACHVEASRPFSERAMNLLAKELGAGLDQVQTYAAFSAQVKETKYKIMEMLIQLKAEGKQIVGYGAPGKGNTLLNYCGIRTDFLDYTVDRNPKKQGNFLPGTRIPIYAPEKIFETQPDYIFILPWNLKDEIMSQMAEVKDWGGRFIIPIPNPVII